MKLLFATSNKNKLVEIQKMLPSEIELLSLEDINLKTDIPETSSTIEGNAKQKSDYILEHFGIDCFADDTGLEVDALNGEPGVFSARYAGEDKDDAKNRQLLLKNLTDVINRKARFKTVISLEFKGSNYLFEGIVEGEITNKEKGNKGFGYDSIFIPENHDLTFAQLDLATKNKISHRGIAFQKMINFLNEQF
jgi:XTP/dITP diphosphohydrolase